MTRLDNSEAWETLLVWSELLVVMICYSALSGAFWAGFTIGSAWVWRLAGGAPVAVLFGAGVLLSVPALYVQLAVITDAVGQIIIGHVGIVPRLLESPHSLASTPLRVLVTVVSLTSPFAGASAIALYKLVPTSRPFQVVSIKARIETHATAIVLDRLRRRASRLSEQ